MKSQSVRKWRQEGLTEGKWVEAEVEKKCATKDFSLQNLC